MYQTISLFNLDISTYFLWLSLTISICLFYFAKQAQLAKIPRKLALDLYLVIMLASLFGSRILHIIYEEPTYYLENPLKIFNFWDGGFVFYGGLMAVLICGYLFLRFKKVASMAEIFDVTAPVASFGYALGRWACFWAGCCYGKTCDRPWSVGGRHPTQIYSSIWEVGVWLILLGLKNRLRRPGDLFAVWIMLHSCGRFFIEFFRDDFRGPLYVFSISGWISLLLFLSGFVYLLRSLLVKSKN